MLFYILYLSLVARVAPLHININYSFKLPEVFGIGNHNDSGCCPFIIYPKNDTGSLRIPDFLIIGVQKSSSSTLAKTLNSHPSIVMSDKKELNWLGEDGITADYSYQEYLKHWDINYSDNTTIVNNIVKVYNNKIKHFGTEVLLFEATPVYLMTTIAACKTKYYFPNAKLIVIFRDPSDRVYSNYKFTRRRCIERNKTSCAPLEMSFYEIAQSGLEVLQKTDCSFNTGFGNLTYNDCFKCLASSYWINPPSKRGLKMLLRFGFDRDEYESISYASEVILRGMYGAQMAWWFHFFKPEQFMLISYFDFVKDDTLGVLNRIVDFVGLEKHFQINILSEVGKRKEHNEEEDEDGSVAKGYKILKDFYKRPNLEFYKLLIDNGHDFRPFEDEFRNYDFIDCGDYLTAKSGICGDQNSLKNLRPLTTQEMIRYTKKTGGKGASEEKNKYIKSDSNEDLINDSSIIDTENHEMVKEYKYGSLRKDISNPTGTDGKPTNLYIDTLNKDKTKYVADLDNHNKKSLYSGIYQEKYVLLIFSIFIIAMLRFHFS